MIKVKKSEQKTLFSIEIKISGELVNIPVFQNDCHESLIERFCQTNAIKSDYRSIVKDKIIQSLLDILKSQQMPKNLKDKIQKFVNDKKENEVISSRLKNSSQKNKASSNSVKNKKSTNDKSNDTPYNILHRSFLVGSNSPPNRHQNAHQNQPEKPQQINRSLNCSRAQKNHDHDLIKAYQTIAKNCDDKVMKEMAKKFLKISQQKLKEKDLNKAKQTVNVSQFKQTNSPSKKNQKKSVNINKVVQQSRKLQVGQHQSQSFGNLGKRYKYYRQHPEESIIVPQLKSNLYYQTSKAFQRTPINILYDPSGSSMSRNILQSSSLGRTKKYRYITD